MHLKMTVDDFCYVKGNNKNTGKININMKDDDDDS